MDELNNPFELRFDAESKVTLQIDGDLANSLLTLAGRGAFGPELEMADLQYLVTHLLAKRLRAGQRKLKRLKEAREKDDSAKGLGDVGLFEQVLEKGAEGQSD